MNDLGLGLLAADAYFKADDSRVLREQQRQQFDWQKQRAESELSTLPDKTNAARTGFQLQAARNNSGIQLLPGQTANAQARQNIEGADLAGAAQRQPAEIATKGIRADMDLSNAQNDQTNQPMVQSIKNKQLQGLDLTADADLRQLPGKLQRLAMQGVLDHQAQGEIVLGNLGKIIGNQDKAGALQFANEIAKQSDVIPRTNGKTFTDIKMVRRGQDNAPDDGYVFVTSDGEQAFVPADRMAGAMNSLKSGKYHFLHTNDGAVFAGNEATGAVRQVRQGDPLGGPDGRKHTPAEIQSVEWLMARVPRLRDKPEEAWNEVRKARGKSRESFVTEYVLKNAMPGQDPRKMAEEAGHVYDAIPKEDGMAGNAPAASNTPAQGTFDPKIKSLIGIP